MMKFNRLRLLLWLWFILVGLFPLLTGLAILQESLLGPGAPIWFGPVFVAEGRFWTYVPGILFGGRFVEFGIGVWPRGVAGWLVITAFYTIVSVLIWAPFGVRKRT